MSSFENEMERQQIFEWERSSNYDHYNTILGFYQVQSCLENARGESVLDLACGDGFLTSLLCKHFKRVVAVDASKNHLENARRRLPDVEFHECLIEEFETDEKFDTVLMLNVLEHVIDPGIVLEKAAGFLKENGTLIVHVPNANAINRRIAVIMGTLESCDELSPFDINVAGHRRSYTMSSFVNEINNSGLAPYKTGGIFYKMLSTPQMNWFLSNGLWIEGGFGWGRVGAEPKDWEKEFCKACYEIGKTLPEDCNIIYACIKNG